LKKILHELAALGGAFFFAGNRLDVLLDVLHRSIVPLHHRLGWTAGRNVDKKWVSV